MELQLRQETAQCWETVCRVTVEQEEMEEVIVPDACPDIQEVLDGETRLLLQRKEAREGGAELSGTLKTSILYRPEGETGVCAMEATMPFALSPDLSGADRTCVIMAVPRVLRVDIHPLNPRKVLVKVGFQLALEVLRPQTLCLNSLVEDPEPWGVRQKLGEIRCDLTVCAQEKRFTYRDTLVLPAGQPSAAALLRSRARAFCSEAKVIGEKIVLKGEAVLELLCREEDGGLFPVEFRLPFSQILDGGEDCEEGRCSVELLLTEMKCLPVAEDPRSFQAELAFLAQARVRKERELPLLTDLYSTSHTLDVVREERSFQSVGGEGDAQETLRETLEAMGEVREVSARLGRLRQSRDGEDLILEQEILLSLILETEEGAAGLQHTAVLSHRLPRQTEELIVSAELTREPTAVRAGEGIEVTVPVSLRWSVLRKQSQSVISQVSVREDREEEEGPSLMIRAVRQGQSLWDVAKACRSTEAAILAASGLGSGELYPGQLLLIPCKTK